MVKITTEPVVSKDIDIHTITFSSNGREVSSYFHGYNNPEEIDERYKRGGYLHPVRSPNGVVLNNHLNPDVHPHHSGIWSAWERDLPTRQNTALSSIMANPISI